MKIIVLCLTYGPRTGFLRDFIESFKKNSQPDTCLILGVQEPDSAMRQYLWQSMQNSTLPREMAMKMFDQNHGLNAYDSLVELIQDPDALIIDTDDDSELFPGYEKIFQWVLADERFGWVGIPHTELTLEPFPNGRAWDIRDYHIVEAPVGGGLAATRYDVWKSVGGFGQGRTLFDPEDARYQKKCIQNNYLTGMITNCPRYEHHGSWAWHIKYGTAPSKMDALFQAMQSGFLTEEGYRQSCQAYLAEASKVSIKLDQSVVFERK